MRMALLRSNPSRNFTSLLKKISSLSQRVSVSVFDGRKELFLCVFLLPMIQKPLNGLCQCLHNFGFSRPRAGVISLIATFKTKHLCWDEFEFEVTQAAEKASFFFIASPHIVG